MRLDVVDDVADLAGFEGAAQAAQNLIGAARALVDHELLREAQVARLRPVPVPHFALRDDLGRPLVEIELGAVCCYGLVGFSSHAVVRFALILLLPAQLAVWVVVCREKVVPFVTSSIGSCHGILGKEWNWLLECRSGVEGRA